MNKPVNVKEINYVRYAEIVEDNKTTFEAKRSTPYGFRFYIDGGYAYKISESMLQNRLNYVSVVEEIN